MADETDIDNMKREIAAYGVLCKEQEATIDWLRRDNNRLALTVRAYRGYITAAGPSLQCAIEHLDEPIALPTPEVVIDVLAQRAALVAAMKEINLVCLRAIANATRKEDDLP